MEILVLQGIPGSGKSTFAREFLQFHPDYVRINRDDLRNMSGKYWVPKREDYISEAEKSLVDIALKNKYNVILDATNLNPKTLKWIKEVANKYNANIEYKKMDTPLEECIRRDSLRPYPVGESEIKRMYNTYYDEQGNRKKTN